MLKGFKKSVDVDFTVSKNRVKMEEAFKQVEKEIGQVYTLIIGGKRIETEKKITSLNPATKEVLGYACSCSQEFADEAIKTAQEAFKTWSVTPVEERVTLQDQKQLDVESMSALLRSQKVRNGSNVLLLRWVERMRSSLILQQILKRQPKVLQVQHLPSRDRSVLHAQEQSY